MHSVSWFKNAVIYQVFIDRFFGFEHTENSPRFLGGNLKGVTAKLDYLQSLGINVVWLSPFYETANYHGYHITDFKKVDPRFGTTDDLLHLISEAKNRGMKVIADFVPNHCSDRHPFFLDAVKNKTSAYSNWFIFTNWPKEYLCFLEYKELPKLNLENRETRDYILDVADYWLSLGLDGYRIDHVIGPSHSFWKEFRQNIMSKYSDAVLIGEVWVKGIKNRHFKTIGIKNKFSRKILGISQENIQLEYYKELDGVLDFALNDMLTGCVKRNCDIRADKQLQKKIKKHFQKVPLDYIMVTFLDNHDMDRFLRHCRGNVEVLLNAFEVLFLLNCPVVIYNGTENCDYNKTPLDVSVNNSDLAVREPINWNTINQQFIDGFRHLVKKYNRT